MSRTASAEETVDLEVVEARSGRHLVTLVQVLLSTEIRAVKRTVNEKYPKVHISRIQFRIEARGKAVKDDDTVGSLGLKNGSKLYLKDLGPQIGWKTVFVVEYLGPLLIYPLFYARPELIYGEGASSVPYHGVVQIAAACWTLHYAKRLFETLFVHRFSHGTMPLSNLFKNSLYYWGFSCLVGYFVNHPLYTPPAFGSAQIGLGLFGFMICEYGNFAIHSHLRDLRPAGSTERRIPLPSTNPFTWLFNYVSCPNYTYEVGAWIAFAGMTQTLTAGIFALVGLGQMAAWALGKHRNYRREFPNYPKKRKSILPFLI